MTFSMLTALLAQYSYPTPSVDPSAIAGAFAGVMVFYLIVLVLGLAAMIAYYFCLYHLITSDSTYYPDGIAEKKKWFWFFTLSPLIMLTIIGIFVYPFVFVGLVAYYLFAVRPKVEERKRSMMNGGSMGAQPAMQNPMPTGEQM